MSIGDDDPVPLPTGPTRIVKISFDGASIRRARPEVEQERDVAIYDILDGNYFAPMAADGTLRTDGPYVLVIGMSEDRLVINIATEAAPEQPYTLMLSLSPLKRVMKDYFLICETYYQAIRTQPPSKIQAIDMGRRGLHDEGSRILAERLEGKVTVDKVTARRLFTLICALQWKG
jgi:uncharacterized protein (UPF0262 family)